MSLDHQFQTSGKIHATQKMSKSGFFWIDKKEQILADYRAEIHKHEFQANYDRRKIQKLNGVIESRRGEILRALQGDEQHRRDQQLLHVQLLEQNRDLREAHEKVSMRWKNSSDFKALHSILAQGAGFCLQCRCCRVQPRLCKSVMPRRRNWQEPGTEWVQIVRNWKTPQKKPDAKGRQDAGKGRDSQVGGQVSEFSVVRHQRKCFPTRGHV